MLQCEVVQPYFMRILYTVVKVEVEVEIERGLFFPGLFKSVGWSFTLSGNFNPKSS